MDAVEGSWVRTVVRLVLFWCNKGALEWPVWGVVCCVRGGKKRVGGQGGEACGVVVQAKVARVARARRLAVWWCMHMSLSWPGR